MEVSSSYLKASLLFAAFAEGRTEIMPYVHVANDVGVRPFTTIGREDRVERVLLPLLDRFNLPKFQAWIRDNFASGPALL